VPKPSDVFDRDREWEALERFARAPGHRFGLAYGRRRQGKSWLCERLARSVSGWYWEAFEGTARQHLDAFAAFVAERARMAARPRLADWAEALDAVWAAAPPLVVIDELSYLVAASPELPSLLQARVSRAGGPRVLVCGSALGPMRALLGTDAPLRGRASLELVVRPFDFRTAARFWRVGRDLETAVRLHALVGGTPAYVDLAGGRRPSASASFDDWVCDVLLDPAGALFREGRILADEAALTDRGLYHGILSAIAGGQTRRGQIASVVGRPDNTLAHPLNVLVDLGLCERIEDPLHARRSFFRLAEPMLRTYEQLVAPNEGVIERRGSRRVWPSLAPNVASRIYGPHFEHLAREWIATHASEETLGGLPERVGPSVIGDASARRELEIDAVATSGDRVLAIGEVKWSVSLPDTALAAADRKRALLGSRAERAKILLFARGFSADVRARARARRDVELVDLARLYGGS
jgi:AAA+ ATPase superfamily predicted ATPase